jgi:phage terminase large subunit GpA-like protein
MYCYAGVRGDYFEQVCESEYRVLDVKKKKYKYIHKTAIRNEALDCEVLALHAAIGGGLHTSMLNKWAYLENEYAMQHDAGGGVVTKQNKKEVAREQTPKKETKKRLSYEEKLAKYRK